VHTALPAAPAVADGYQQLPNQRQEHPLVLPTASAAAAPGTGVLPVRRATASAAARADDIDL
jgi:hypothetical protein